MGNDIASNVFDNAIKYLNKVKPIIYTNEFINLVSLLTIRRSWTTGVGKAALAAHKLASTLSSNGTPSTYAHATELLHGDLGSVRSDNILIAFSNSGKTDQILEISNKLREMNITFVLITGDGKAEIAKNAAIILDYGKLEESCMLNLTPTTSTTIQLVIADAIAMSVQDKRGLTYQDYSKFHGAGYLGYIARLKLKVDNRE